ncbi:MAG: RNA polymerase sigma factor [Polyangiaceae bacterium]
MPTHSPSASPTPTLPPNFVPGAAAMAKLEEAMAELAHGRIEAFSSVYRLGKAPIDAFLKKLGADAVTAEDLTHETLLRVYRARSRYRVGASVLSWARTIARRLYIDRLRDSVQSSVAHEAFYEALPSSLASRRPDDVLAIRRLAQAVNATLESLPPAQAQAFHLVFEEGMSFPEASAKLGESRVCLRLRSHRACKALRGAVDADALHP